MKISEDGRFWIKEEKGIFEVGITKEYKDRMGLVWALVPRRINKVDVGTAFASVESSKCLLPLRSPVKGTILEFNEKFLVNPEKLDHNNYLIKVRV